MGHAYSRWLSVYLHTPLTELICLCLFDQKKKQRVEKRRFSSSEEEQNKKRGFKQRRLSEEEEEEEVQTEAPPPAGAQAPPTAQTDRRTPQKNKKDGVKETGRSSIKTSSLFKHNPEIPEIHSPVVSQLKEKIFTSDSFSDLNLHPHLVATLNKVLNVSTVTSVQKQTIPVLLSGHDAVVRSQTGSGKTLSYAVPVVQSLQAVQPKVSRSDGPLAIVIVPTREVRPGYSPVSLRSPPQRAAFMCRKNSPYQQTFQTFQKLVKPFTWIVPGVLMGGEKRKAEKARLRKGINILVSTPGRLVDHIKHTLSIAFSAVRWLILDEADRRTSRTVTSPGLVALLGPHPGARPGVGARRRAPGGRVFAHGTRPGSARNGNVGPPSSRLTTLQEGP
ncbi:hypothetical protein L3Q82_007036 [Scortum barcoo]|uniref:Uncharacterized protein n=1 Tax=Scortum barcoo TaxID=214431 RepID=A0ACB8WWN8_9TELE|nr:hypothetical protein L3Q82_007036 [Scortum barcoo]